MTKESLNRNPIAASNAQAFFFYDQMNHQYLTDFERWRKKVFDNPYTDKQMAQISDNGLDTGTFVNAYARIIETWVAMMYSNKNGMTVIPSNGNPKKAFLWQLILAAAQQINHLPLVYQRVLTDTVIGGIGFLMVDVDDSFNPNPLGFTYKYMDVAKCRWSNNYSHPLMDDLDEFIYFDTMTVKAAIVKSGLEFDKSMLEDITQQILNFPESLKSTPSLSSLSQQSMGSQENRLVPWIELYRKEYVGYVELLTHDDSKNNIVGRKLVQVDEYDKDASPAQNAMSYFISQKKSNEEASDIIEKYKKIGDMKNLRLKRVVKQVSIGGLDVGGFTLPTSHFPFVPFKFKEIDNSNPIGIMKQIEGMGTTLNQAMLMKIIKARKLMPKWLAPNGAVNIADKTKFAKEASDISSVIWFDPVSLGSSGGSATPELMAPASGADSLSEVMEFVINEMMQSTGVDEAMMGLSQGGTPMSGAAIGQLQSAGSLKLKMFADKLQVSMARVGKLSIDYCKSESKDDVVVRYFEGNEELLGYAAADDAEAMMQDPTAVAVRADAPGYNVEVPINKRVKFNGHEMMINDLRDTDVDLDVFVVGSPAVESSRRMQAAVMQDLIHQMPIPQVGAALVEPLLKALDIPQAHQIAKKLDQTQSLIAENEELKKKIEIANSEQVRLMQQNIRAKDTAEVAKFKANLDGMLSELKAQVDEQMKTTGAVEPELIKEIEKRKQEAEEFLENDGNIEETVEEASPNIVPT